MDPAILAEIYGAMDLMTRVKLDLLIKKNKGK